MLVFFLVAREFEVGEKVTDKFASLHPERNETVGILNGTDRKRFLHLVGIEVGEVGVGIEGEMRRVGNDALMDVCFRKGDGWGFCFPNFKKIAIYVESVRGDWKVFPVLWMAARMSFAWERLKPRGERVSWSREMGEMQRRRCSMLIWSVSPLVLTQWASYSESV